MRNQSLRPLLSICIASLLLACGGGDGGSSTPGTGAIPIRPIFDPLVLTADPSTHPEGSEEQLAFKTLNIERVRCGFGALAQNVHLDTAARAHREYLELNAAWTHREEFGKPGFSGHDAAGRATAAGFGSTWVSEGIAGGDSASRAMRALLAAPYHAIDMLYGWKELGVAFGNRTLVAVYGHAGTLQGSGDVLTYPCVGTSGVYAAITQETPAPFANYNEVWGQPVVVMAPTSFELSTAHMLGPGGPVKIKVIYGKGHTTDAHGRCVARWTCIIPEPLQPFSTYEVQLTWIQDGQPGGRTFSFETGRN
jgi:hypothetical protein